MSCLIIIYWLSTLHLFRSKIFLRNNFTFYSICFAVKYLVKNKIFSSTKQLRQICVKCFTLEILVKLALSFLLQSSMILYLHFKKNLKHSNSLLGFQEFCIVTKEEKKNSIFNNKNKPQSLSFQSSLSVGVSVSFCLKFYIYAVTQLLGQ